jgi:hypothetical protein
MRTTKSLRLGPPRAGLVRIPKTHNVGAQYENGFLKKSAEVARIER